MHFLRCLPADVLIFDMLNSFVFVCLFFFAPNYPKLTIDWDLLTMLDFNGAGMAHGAVWEYSTNLPLCLTANDLETSPPFQWTVSSSLAWLASHDSIHFLIVILQLLQH